MELTDLYSRTIIELAGRLKAGSRLTEPDATARKVSRICGSVVEVDLRLEDGAITDYAQEVQACALGQTAASVVAEHVSGSTAQEMRELRDRMFRMLKADGPPPEGKWADLRFLEPVRDFAPRHASTMLVFDAIVDALDQIEARSGTHA